MKYVDRHELMKMNKGTVFCKLTVDDNFVEQLCVLDRVLYNMDGTPRDFYYFSITPTQSAGTEDLTQELIGLRSYVRDGEFSDIAKYLVYDKKDKENILQMLW